MNVHDKTDTIIFSKDDVPALTEIAFNNVDETNTEGGDEKTYSQTMYEKMGFFPFDVEW